MVAANQLKKNERNIDLTNLNLPMLLVTASKPSGK